MSWKKVKTLEVVEADNNDVVGATGCRSTVRDSMFDAPLPIFFWNCSKKN